MSSGKKRKRGNQGRKPRGSQAPGHAGDLGSLGERDAMARWIRDQLRPGDLIATAQPAGYEDTGIDLPAEAGAAPGSRVWRPAPGTPGAVIDIGRPAPPGQSQTAIAGPGPGQFNPAYRHRGQGAPGSGRYEPVIPPGLSAANAGFLAAARDREGPGTQFGTPHPGLPDEVRQRLEAASPGLAGRLAQGLTRDELSAEAGQITRALQQAGAGPGSYTFGGTGEKPVPGRYAVPGGAEIIVTDDLADVPDDAGPALVIEDLDPEDEDAGRLLIGSPAEVRRYHETAARLDRRAAPLVPGPDERGLVRDAVVAEGRLGSLQSAWRADAVLDMHAWLTKNYRQPGDDLADYLARLIRGFVGQGGTAMMFYPIEVRRGDPADRPEGRQLAMLLARGLGEAATYQVTAPMCRRMTETWDVARPAFREVLPLDEGELPAPAGFAWLDLPWLIREDAGYWLPVRAVSWETTTVLMEGQVTGGRTITADSARITLWVLSSDDVAFGRWEPDRSRAERAANRVGRLTPVHVMMMPFGTRMPVNRGHTTLIGAFGLLHILWMYLGMELPRSRPLPAAAPGVRARAAKSLKHAEVHVVTLRPVAYIGEGTPGHRQVNRTCKWWVDDFCRHIDPYQDEDSEGRPRRHEAVPASRAGYVPDDDHDICGVCLARGQTVRIALVHGHRRGPAWLPWKTPAKDRTVYRLSR